MIRPVQIWYLGRKMVFHLCLLLNNNIFLSLLKLAQPLHQHCLKSLVPGVMSKADYIVVTAVILPRGATDAD